MSEATLTERRKDAVLVPILALYIVLALIYAYATPLFEAPDELYHFAFVNRVANTGRLPVQTPRNIGVWEQEGSQPPLYYLIAGALVAGIPRDDFAALRQPNPHAVIGVTGRPDNKNRFLADSPYPPPLGERALVDTALAAYTARLFSIALGAVTVIAVYGCARAVVPGRPAVATLAAALTAFNPQFLFISSAVNNDALVAALNSLALWAVADLLRAGRFDARRSLAVALVIALATLSKLSGLVVVPVAALAGLYIAWRTRDLRGLLVMGGAMLGAWLILAGWWYVRNLSLYGELFGSARMLDIFGRRAPPPLPDLLRELTSLIDSYWGVFGWFSVLTFDAYYGFVSIVTLAGFGGWLLHLWRMRRDRDQGVRFAFMALAWVLGFISLLAWTLQTTGTQGRLLFPYIAPASLILAVGWLEWGERLGRARGGDWTAGLIVAPLIACAALIPFITLIPTYLPPVPIIALPAEAAPLAVEYRGRDEAAPVALAGFEADDRRHAPGEQVDLTLYWRPLLRIDRDLSTFVHLHTVADNVRVGQWDSYPGAGALRTTTWLDDLPTGALYPDRIRIRLDPALSAGARSSALVAYVGWWDLPWGHYLSVAQPYDEHQVLTTLPVGALVGEETPPDPADFTALAGQPTFGGVFRLLGYQAAPDALTLLWETRRAPEADYAVTAHVWAGALTETDTPPMLAQADAAPDLPTRYRLSGERFVTQHRWRAPTGEAFEAAPDAPIYLGWYHTVSGERLALPDGVLGLLRLPAPITAAR
jgi:hypothetical protein